MAKTGSILRGSRGKVAGMTVYTMGGETIIRDSRKQSSNTVASQAQINQRARFKLLSQLASVFSTTISIPRAGLLTGRSQFQRINSGLVTANEGEAIVTLENIQLTKSSVGLPALQVGRRSASAETFDVMLDGAALSLNGVVYNVYSKTDEGNLMFQASTVVTEPNDNWQWDGKLPNVEGEILVLAYGFAYRNSGIAALTRYGSMQALTGEDVARLVATSQLDARDLSFTQTRGAMQDADGNAIDPATATKVRVYLTASPTNGGTVTGAGSYDRGTSVTVTASPASGYTFTGWRRNGESTYVSTAASYTVASIQSTQDLIAVFAQQGGGTLNPD